MPQALADTVGVHLESEVVLSPRFHGLCFYAARLLRPLWGASLFLPPVSAARARTGAAVSAPPAAITDWLPVPRWTEAELRAVLAPLFSLREAVRLKYR